MNESDSRKRRRAIRNRVSYLDFMMNSSSDDESAQFNIAVEGHEPHLREIGCIANTIDNRSVTKHSSENEDITDSYQEVDCDQDESASCESNSDLSGYSYTDAGSYNSGSISMHSEDIQEPISTRGGENHSQLSRELADWHVRTRTPQSHTDDLLRILRKYHGELPLTARTLLQTDRSKTTLSVVEPGFYHHFGIQNGILDTFVLNDLGNTSTNAICSFVGVDGIALVKSSSSQFWAVVGYLPCFPKSKPFVIGVYHGYTKPQSSNSFLKELVEEAQALYHEGFQYNGELIRVVIGAFICDAPARAMIACVKSHSSTNFGCARCTGFGANIGFLRSNISFREGCHPTHHNSKSILEMLPYLDMVRDLPLDPMHLLYLGVMRKILYYLIGRGNRRYPKITLSVGVVKRIDSFLIKLRNYISRLDFARKPRSTGEFPRWKATELREFLHYIGVVVFKQYLSVEYYTHFLLLHVAVKLLSQDNITVDDRQYADELLNCFVTNCESFYGKSFVTYNVHSLLHLVDDVSRFGALDRFSAFRFENFYGHMKHYLKKMIYLSNSTSEEKTKRKIIC